MIHDVLAEGYCYWDCLRVIAGPDSVVKADHLAFWGLVYLQICCLVAS